MFKKQLIEQIRCIPDYPKEGIVFRDITTLLNHQSFISVIEHLKEYYQNQNIHYIAGLESRGFIFGAPLAYALGVGFVPIRKKGKLPFKKISQSYELEYGSDELEIHLDAFEGKQGARVLLVDDLIATGGSAEAGVKLIESVGGECVGACFLIDLSSLGGSSKLSKLTQVYSILEF